MKNSLITIALVAGESSGDLLGARLIRALKLKCSTLRFVGIGGPLMREQGCEILFNMEELAVMGLVEIISKIPKLLILRKKLIKTLSCLRPAVFIGIDSPDFNLFIEKKLKQQGVAIIHYVSPSVWAWRKWRVSKIADAVDLLLTLFPFESLFYDKYKISCHFVGHTLADIMPLQPDRWLIRKKLKIMSQVICLALLPGSRFGEIKRLSAPFLQTAMLLKVIYPDLQVIVPMVNKKRCIQFLQIKQQIAPELPLKIYIGKSQDVLCASDAALVAAGTATLESMLAKCPMVVGYKLNPLSYYLVKYLVKIPYVALPNILANRVLVKEFLQQKCQSPVLLEALLCILKNKKKYVELKQIFTQLHQQLRCDADSKAADAVLSLIKNIK